MHPTQEYRFIRSDKPRVYADGQLLHPHYEICNHSPDGFEWGYGGSGPAQLAFAILYNYFDGNEKLVWPLYQDFKWAYIATLPEAGGAFNRALVTAWIRDAVKRFTNGGSDNRWLPNVEDYMAFLDQEGGAHGRKI